MENAENPVVARAVLSPEGLTDAIRSANLEPCQLSPSPTASQIARVSCPTVTLDYVALGPSMLFSGVMPVDCYTLVFVTSCPTQGRSFNFSTEHLDGYMGFFPPGGLVDAFTPAGYANASLTVPTAIFHLAIERLFPEIPHRILKHGAGMRVGTSEQTHLGILLSAVMAGIRDSTGSLTCLLARSSLESQLLDAFICALRSGSSDLTPEPNRRIAGRLKRLRQARDFIEASASEQIHLEDLRVALGMSARGIEVLFRSSFGITSNAFIRNTRLNEVRRELLAASPAPGVVGKIAQQAGFWHLGHFSVNYRSLFGESPTSTLTRPRA